MDGPIPIHKQIEDNEQDMKIKKKENNFPRGTAKESWKGACHIAIFLYWAFLGVLFSVFGSDGTSVMTGADKGVKSYLLRKYFHWMAYRLAFCTRQAVR